MITVKNDAAELEPSSETEKMPSFRNLLVMENVNPKNFDFNDSQGILDDGQTTELRQKKGGPFEHYKKGLLKKYSGSGSRNCFFTPIQCMIQHDMSKYKKLVDSNIQIGRITRRSVAYPF